MSYVSFLQTWFVRQHTSRANVYVPKRQLAMLTNVASCFVSQRALRNDIVTWSPSQALLQKILFLENYRQLFSLMSFKINVPATIERNMVRLDLNILEYYIKRITTIIFLIIFNFNYD